jgi:thymidylate synthase
MSLADQLFVDMCQDIIANGVSTEGEKVRPVWTDTGESAYTIKKFGVVNRYDLRKEFPALTLRRTAIKSCTNEMLWIWQQKSNNIHDLKSTVWDEWADATGSIGKAYGYQIAKKYAHHKAQEEDLSAYPSAEIREENGVTYVFLDQIDGVRYDLKNHPFSRRIIANIYNLEDLHEMHLYPCAYSMTFNVTTAEGGQRLVLNAILNQRSQDILAANNWNVCQYAILLHMIARDCDMEPGELVHVIADAHIYDRHIPIVKELITRPQQPAPQFILNPEKHDFYDFTAEDIRLENYVTGPQVRDIPIAV